MTAAMPAAYAEAATHHAPPNIAPATRVMTGSLAPQGINDVVIMLILRWGRLSTVLVAIMPGTLQPVPSSMGINDRPDRPSRRKMRSIKKAIRAI